MNTEEFIKKSKDKYGDKRFDYSETEYVNKNTKVKIICKKHGLFETSPQTHLRGAGGCKECSGRQNIDTHKFIKLSKEIHGDKYDYSLVNYKNNYTKVKIICPIHGEFEQTPKLHLKGCDCKKCSCRATSEEFIEKAQEVHNINYDYSCVHYIKGNVPVEIICPKHGSFWQTPEHHLTGCDCPECAREIFANKMKSTTDEFIKKAKSIHGDKYDYSKTNYIKSNEPVEIICSKHDSFWQTQSSHLSGHGCPVCKGSNGEAIISTFLTTKGCSFISEKTLQFIDKTWCFIDFWTEFGAIEFDGLQHFEPNKFFGGVEGFKSNIERDEKKNIYCKENNIPLLRIRYDQMDDIEEILDHFLANPDFYKHRYNPYLTNEEYYSIREAV